MAGERETERWRYSLVRQGQQYKHCQPITHLRRLLTAAIRCVVMMYWRSEEQNKRLSARIRTGVGIFSARKWGKKHSLKLQRQERAAVETKGGQRGKEITILVESLGPEKSVLYSMYSRFHHRDTDRWKAHTKIWPLLPARDRGSRAGWMAVQPY